MKDPRGAGYPEQFKTEGSHDLTKVARFESYRGFLFGSLNPDVPPLKEHLGGTAKIIDMIADQTPGGLEVLRAPDLHLRRQLEGPGRERRRWLPRDARCTGIPPRPRPGAKRRIDQRAQGAGRGQLGQAPAAATGLSGSGHTCSGASGPTREDRARWDKPEEIAKRARRDQGRVGCSKFSRNQCVYPNVYLMDQSSSQIRYFRPMAAGPDQGHHLLHRPQGRERRGPQGADPPVRGLFQCPGMATADDLEEFRACQKAALASASPWNDISRGAEHWVERPGPGR